MSYQVSRFQVEKKQFFANFIPIVQYGMVDVFISFTITSAGVQMRVELIWTLITLIMISVSLLVCILAACAYMFPKLAFIICKE